MHCSCVSQRWWHIRRALISASIEMIALRFTIFVCVVYSCVSFSIRNGKNMVGFDLKHYLSL